MEKTQLLQTCINGVPIPDGWKVKRRSTLFMFLLSGFIQGVDFTTVSATLWVYVNDSLANANPRLHYGLIAGGRYLAPIVFGTVVAGWLDKSRSLKRLTFCIGFLLNIGLCALLTAFFSVPPIYRSHSNGFFIHPQFGNPI